MSPESPDSACQVTRVLFICSRNRLRSPTAERVFAAQPGIACASAGLNHDSENPVTPELLQWADLIFVMETAHLTRLRRRFSTCLPGRRVVCLHIPDRFTFMDPRLVQMLRDRVAPYLRSG